MNGYPEAVPKWRRQGRGVPPGCTAKYAEDKGEEQKRRISRKPLGDIAGCNERRSAIGTDRSKYQRERMAAQLAPHGHPRKLCEVLDSRKGQEFEG